MNEIMNINGIECYEKDGTAYLKLETVARGLGFTTVATSGNEVIRWTRVEKYLSELGFSPQVEKDSFIPENIFYRLAMKAKNETAERFQALVADEIIPSIRKHGAYMTPATIEAAILNPDTMIKLCQQLKAEQDKNMVLQADNSRLTVQNAIMAPKADYFDELVERNTLTNFRETAKQLNIPPKKFVTFLLDRKFIFRDMKGK
ncbi:MAG: phage antirepressor KilAC domain-containing protein [Oscillospiraceae bacterium]|nr:phage antirepressor KilAC domain-containing protein [Oscillospiraceae bacterium]